MSRTVSVLAICACVFAALGPTAAAKELQRVSVCGGDGCVAVPESELSHHLIDGDSTSSPDRAEPHYRIRAQIGAPDFHENFTLKLLPRQGYVRYGDEIGGSYDWIALDAETAALYAKLTSGLEPLRPLGPVRSAAEPSLPPEPQPAETSDGGGEGVAIAGLIAGVLLFGIAGVSLRHRRGANGA
jgi:hypothetical protein